jgi:hypothetical protein
LIGFPHPVNELAARAVAGGVLLGSIATLTLGVAADDGWLWLVAALAYGFVARVLTGPKLSPLGQLATRLVAPRLGPPRLVAGPPKRFAQAIGAVVTVSAVVSLAFGRPLGAEVLLGLLVVAAGLESIAGFCIGCTVFGGLMRIGLVPESTCEACNNIALRTTASA